MVDIDDREFELLETILYDPPLEPLKIILDKECTLSTDMFLYHKTTHRKVYEDARIRMNLNLLPGSKNENNDIFDVLMYNENNEITECSISNIAVEFYDQDKKKMVWKTPKIECGLLPGTMRSYLINLGKIICDKITIDELKIAQQVIKV
ncbi:2503_t:CDS:2 [Diversispora eburnea]|uniref:2503_t:CDS:1 n=1 Tax=Diversispora eburnea TaxID=1213867 RepID=A0A9N8WPS2_9GLOM|nr:2503_t:CDS:2 [Diversispora eburnea]